MKELLKEIELHSRCLPDALQQEVLDFIKFKEQKLKAERSELLSSALLSETSLSEWNNEEEDEAWKHYQ